MGLTKLFELAGCISCRAGSKPRSNPLRCSVPQYLRRGRQHTSLDGEKRLAYGIGGERPPAYAAAVMGMG